MKIYLDGLERSGNVFLSYAISITTEIEVVSARTHLVETLKAYKEEYPFIVPVRDALPSMVSAKIYRDKVLKDNLYGVNPVDQTQDPKYIINTYKKYIDFLLDSPKFFIAPFHEFTKDHNEVIDLIIKPYPGLKRRKTLTADQIMLYASKSNPHSNDTHLGNFPREASEDKSQIEHLFLTNHYQEILGIQDNIDKLYKRYYDLKNML